MIIISTISIISSSLALILGSISYKGILDEVITCQPPDCYCINTPDQICRTGCLITSLTYGMGTGIWGSTASWFAATFGLMSYNIPRNTYIALHYIMVCPDLRSSLLQYPGFLHFFVTKWVPIRDSILLQRFPLQQNVPVTL